MQQKTKNELHMLGEIIDSNSSASGSNLPGGVIYFVLGIPGFVVIFLMQHVAADSLMYRILQVILIVLLLLGLVLVARAVGQLLIAFVNLFKFIGKSFKHTKK